MDEQASSEYARSLMQYVAEMVAVVNRLRAYPEQPKDEADEDGIYLDVTALTEGVCGPWSTAACVKLPERIEYGGRGYASYTEVLFFQAYEVYQAMNVLVSGHMDDSLCGYLDADTVLERWPEVAAKLREPGLLRDAGELAQLAEVASRELSGVQPKEWIPQIAYEPPGEPEDRWSPEAAERQRARLAAYREGGAFTRQTEPGNPHVSDVMLVFEGEPGDRFVTKLGGLPYRPASVPWPRIPSGEPMVFFGQVCFADSRDLVGELPGDVLLIFTHGEHDHTSGDGLHYEWYPLGIEGLVTAAEVPDTPWGAAPYFMHLSRREEDEHAEGWPEWMQSPKIGGRAYWIQHDPDDFGTFLACFGSLYRCGEPDTSDPRIRKLDFFDAGLLNLCLLPDSCVGECFQCY